MITAGIDCGAKNTKTVIMSGHAIEPIKKQLKNYSNVVGYLPKPFDYTELKNLASQIDPEIAS